MRHRKNSVKLGRTSSHRRCMLANLLKSLIDHERIETTLEKAKFIKRYADKMITLAKKDTLDARRRAIAMMMVRFNALTPKEKKAVKGGDNSSYNTDRTTIHKLFTDLGQRFKDRNGGYTRVLRIGKRTGDQAEVAVIEYLAS